MISSCHSENGYSWPQIISSVIAFFTIQYEFKKHNKKTPRFKPKSLKSKRKIMTLLSVDNSIFFFFSFIWYIDGSYWVRTGFSAIIYCRACQICLCPSFVIVHNAVRMHELLRCCESSRKCHHAAHTTPTWTTTIFDVFYKMYCCVAIRGRI